MIVSFSVFEAAAADGLVVEVVDCDAEDAVVDEISFEEDKLALLVMALVSVREAILLLEVLSPFWNGRAITTPRSIVVGSEQQFPS